MTTGRVLAVIIMLAPVAVLPFLVIQAGPAWSAHLGHGQHGTFTANSETCQAACDWYGTFTATDGQVTYGVMIADGTSVSGIGEQLPAIYAGGSGPADIVFPAGGGSNWIRVTVLVILDSAVVALEAGWLARRYFRRRRRGTRRDGNELAGLPRPG